MITTLIINPRIGSELKSNILRLINAANSTICYIDRIICYEHRASEVFQGCCKVSVPS